MTEVSHSAKKKKGRKEKRKEGKKEKREPPRKATKADL